MAVRNEKSERRNASKRAYFTALRTLCHDFVRKVTFSFNGCLQEQGHLRWLFRAWFALCAVRNRRTGMDDAIAVPSVSVRRCKVLPGNLGSLRRLPFYLINPYMLLIHFQKIVQYLFFMPASTSMKGVRSFFRQ